MEESICEHCGRDAAKFYTRETLLGKIKLRSYCERHSHLALDDWMEISKDDWMTIQVVES
jgi:hypothetical protein